MINKKQERPLMKALNISYSVLASKSRKKEVMNMKKAYCFLMYDQVTECTYEDLGERLNNIDHTTARHHVIDARWLVKHNTDFKEKIERAISQLKHRSEGGCIITSLKP